jgi:hypothetical protein
MPNATRRESRACPTCRLRLTILHTSAGTTVEYDVAEWTQLCHHPGSDSPIVCPDLQPLMKTWLKPQ